MNPILSLFSDFFNLFFPLRCCGCDAGLLLGEKYICLQCMSKLPKTNFHRIVDNPVEKLFWGRVNFERASAYLLFVKHGMTQKIIHNLKYRNRPDVGEYLGRICALDYADSTFFENIDCLIPVPLHEIKKRKRGYNQSFHIAKGISQVTNIPVIDDVLIRRVYNESQTKKNRAERFANVENDYAVVNHSLIADKHCLLIDDVLTTGATIDACAAKLLAVSGTKLSILTMACA